MKNKILSYLLGGFFVASMLFVAGNIKVYADCDCPEEDTGCWMACHYESEGYQEYNTPEKCNGIKLNTNFPIIGNCITTKGGGTDPTMAFPVMIGALTKIAMALVLIVCFIFVIVAGIKWSSDDPKGARDILKKVAVTVLLLGFSGVILRLINPNFFGGRFT